MISGDIPDEYANAAAPAALSALCLPVSFQLIIYLFPSGKVRAKVLLSSSPEINSAQISPLPFMPNVTHL
jgi:hypothetical protein